MPMATIRRVLSPSGRRQSWGIAYKEASRKVSGTESADDDQFCRVLQQVFLNLCDAIVCGICGKSGVIPSI